MPIQVRAREGDCLCVIAMQNGFLNCQRLRDEPKNRAFLHRPLRDGDIVTVPDIDLKHASRATDAVHKFGKKSAPPVSIRYVRDSAGRFYRDDPDTLILNVSNYPTDIGGFYANAPFPQGFGFHADGQADPDAFKVEVVDPAAGGGSINVAIEALMPVYKLEGDKFIVAGHQLQKGSPMALMECSAIPSGGAFRSKYLRIVTHDEDTAAMLGQTVLVVSPADGKGTGKASDVDTVEILDFEIRATYTIGRCPAPKKCSVSVVRPLGDESEQLRFRIGFHIFKRRDTGSPVGNLTVEKVRHTALGNLRAFYAQASMAPKLVSADGSEGGPAIIFMPEPDNNMIVIGEEDGGVSAHNDQHQPSTLTIFDDSRVIAQISFSEKMNPRHVAAAIENAVDPLTFKVEVFKNPKSASFSQNSPYDVLITRLDGASVDLRVVTDDTRLRHNITVVRVNIDAIEPGNSLHERRVFRSSPGPAGSLNVYAIGKILDNPDDALTGKHTLAFSQPLSFRLQIDSTQARQIADSILCEAAWLDDKTSLPMVLPHECGHVLGRVTHVSEPDPHFPTEMMTKAARSPSEEGPNPTRISDYPILVNYELQEDAVRLINAVNRFRTSRTDLLENW